MILRIAGSTTSRDYCCRDKVSIDWPACAARPIGPASWALAQLGAESVVVSGGYEDDEDYGALMLTVTHHRVRSQPSIGAAATPYNSFRRASSRGLNSCAASPGNLGRANPTSNVDSEPGFSRAAFSSKRLNHTS